MTTMGGRLARLPVFSTFCFAQALRHFIVRARGLAEKAEQMMLAQLYENI